MSRPSQSATVLSMPRPDSLSESQRDGPRPSLSVPVGSMPSHGELCDDSESDSDGTRARPVTGRAGQQAPGPAACSDPFPTVIPWPSTGTSPRQLRAAVTAARVRRAHAARVARDEVVTEACAVTVAASWAGDPGSRRPGHRPKRCGRRSQAVDAKTQHGPLPFGFNCARFEVLWVLLR